MAAVLAAMYLLCHGLALSLLPGHAAVLSFLFLIGAPLLAAVACLWRGSRGQAASGWFAAALAMVLWAGGMALNMHQQVWLGSAAMAGASMLLYVLYGVPLVFVLAHARGGPRYVDLIDGALALMLGYLFFVHTFSFVTGSRVDAQGVDNLRLMFDLENAFIAVSALVRYVATAEAARRAFFRTLALFSGLYLLVAGYINHFSTDAGFGGRVDVVIDLPFLALAVAAMRVRSRGGDPWPVSPRLARMVDVGGSLILPLALLIVSALIVDGHPRLAVAGFVTAMLGFGVRSILMQVGLLERQEALDALARLDGLTGVANRRQFDQVLRSEWSRARRDGRGMALILADVDHFKGFNDRYGHQAGDRCLQEVALALAACAMRGADLVARYGGEEFAVVVPSPSREGVLEVAERMRATVERMRLPGLAPPAVVTVSLGVGLIDAVDRSEPDALLAAADAALYDAKRQGRNRVAERRVPGEEGRTTAPAGGP
ncbi:GGDEF domain-containing protein [Pseudoxanthomonas broegbernensis]|uniref:diguanylate cyclase n=1 Tax=Pseudoxanthomonas broegbernensis TaxID=83619 RepID=A0A7V8GNH1_9GAMM|nr:diguanylate cyclase [Pseudoxanthomonas broegbernensis]KAF1687151.1 GGDEF domain-containing protein [Pseudoxanthomonas broegbernensis]MBB6065871.1 diguanylate cyclase (GGDEF)-like protein [Pseudoxanthomonas broegbernensis]